MTSTNFSQRIKVAAFPIYDLIIQNFHVKLIQNYFACSVCPFNIMFS